jgi:hypothetical protein
MVNRKISDMHCGDWRSTTMAERTPVTGFNAFSVKKSNKGNILKCGLCTLCDEGCDSMSDTDM